MLLHEVLLLCALSVLAICSAKSTGNGGVTFQKVLVKGYSVFINKFNVTIKSSNNLKDEIPKGAIYDALEISSTNIPVLYENSIKDFDNLDELSITSTDLSEIEPGAFKNLPQLRKLELKKNQLKEIKRGVFNDMEISTLDLSNNQIAHIDSDALNDLPNLLNINLNDNKIKIWNKDWFANTPMLSRVSFQFNLIEELPDSAFVNLAGEKKFGSVPLTLNIILNDNKIKKIYRNAFSGLENINNLWLDHNQLTTIDDNWWKNIKIDSLRIGDNSLKCLSGDYQKIFVANTSHIDGNPWDCDCLIKIEEWAKKSNRKIEMFYSKLTCDSQRISQKIDDLNNLLKTIKDRNDVDEEKTNDVESLEK